MAGRICPWCRKLNASGDSRCGSCERWIPPEIVSGLVRELSATELWATKGLAILSLLVFGLEVAMAKGEMLLMGAPHSTLVRFGAFSVELGAFEPWRLLSACFVHIGYAHVVFNVLATADFGRSVEEEVKGVRTLLGFVLSGVAGFAASWLWYADTPYVLTAGGSGGIFGLIGMFGGRLASRREVGWKAVMLRQVGYSFVFFFVFGTNQVAHLVGLATGFALGWLFEREHRQMLRQGLFGIVAAILVAASVGSVVASYLSPAWEPYREAERRAADEAAGWEYEDVPYED